MLRKIIGYWKLVRLLQHSWMYKRMMSHEKYKGIGTEVEILEYGSV